MALEMVLVGQLVTISSISNLEYVWLAVIPLRDVSAV